MKLKFNLLLAGAVIAGGVSLTTWAKSEPAHPLRLGAEKTQYDFNDIQIKNFQDDHLGRIKDLGIDLINGRIVEVLVMTNSSLEGAKKLVAVPPFVLLPDQVNEIYRINVSADVFNSAPAINLKQWGDGVNRSERVAAAYRHFGQEPYFLEEGATASKTDQRPKVALGYVERPTNIVDLPVKNLQNEKFGKVWSLTLDIPKGLILNVIVIAPGNFKTKSIIPATALSFNANRDALLLDESRMEFADEPRYVFTEAAFGNDAYYEQESAKGPHPSVAPEQGSRYRDVDRTVRINKDIRTAKINGRHVQVGTINGRVTLRGWVNTDEDKRRIGEIAIAVALPEIVDNQITVGRPVKGS